MYYKCQLFMYIFCKIKIIINPFIYYIVPVIFNFIHYMVNREYFLIAINTLVTDHTLLSIKFTCHSQLNIFIPLLSPVCSEQSDHQT